MQVTELWVHPIKSLRGHRVPEARLLRTGLEGDRRWMLVDGTGRFLTQRERPELATFSARLAPETIIVEHRGDRLVLPRAIEDGGSLSVTVWRSTVPALAHEAGSRWFEERLGTEVRLVYMPDTTERTVNPKFSQPGDVVSFADGYPLLLITQESLDLLNAKLATPLPMERFRPNVVVAGATPHAEDAWSRFTIGTQSFRGVKPCARCVMTTIDPDHVERTSAEPLRTLASYRRRDGEVFFGMNVLHDGPATLRVGDPVHVP